MLGGSSLSRFLMIVLFKSTGGCTSAGFCSVKAYRTCMTCRFPSTNNLNNYVNSHLAILSLDRSPHSVFLISQR